MNYVVDYKLVDNGVELEREFIPRTLNLTLRLKTKKQTVRNVSVEFETGKFYMTKDKDGFVLDLCKNMVKPGENLLTFSIEERVANTRFLKETRYGQFKLTLSEENINKNSTTNIENLQKHISKIISEFIKES